MKYLYYNLMLAMLNFIIIYLRKINLELKSLS